MSNFDLTTIARSGPAAGRHAVARRPLGYDRLAFWRPAAFLSLLLLGAMLFAPGPTGPHHPAGLTAGFAAAPHGVLSRAADGRAAALAPMPAHQWRLAVDGAVARIATLQHSIEPPHAWIERVSSATLPGWMHGATSLTAGSAGLQVKAGGALLLLALASLMLGRRLGNFRLPADAAART